MKQVITIISLLFALPFLATSQSSHDLKVEVTDTFETAYNIYFDGWELNGFSYGPREVKDSIGLNRVIVYRFWYDSNDPLGMLSATGFLLPVRKKYLPGLEIREYPEGRKGKDSRYD